jgi:hypothetical protein
MIDNLVKFFALQGSVRNFWLALGLYWLPLIICIVCYFVRTVQNFRRDRAARRRPGAIYIPTDDVGSVLGRVFVSIIPVLNLIAVVFDLSPKIFSRFFSGLYELLTQPLVPDDRKYEDSRRRATPLEKANG